MILQVKDLIKDALGLIGAIAIDEEPTTSEYSHGLRTANVMIDGWATQRLLIKSLTSVSFTLTPGIGIYTIGPVGADTATSKHITSARPIRVSSAIYRDQANIDNYIEIIDKATYNNLGDKTSSSGRPLYLCYEQSDTQQTDATGTVYIYTLPDSAYSLSMETYGYLTEFSTITDTVTFEPAYYEALIYNLAVRLFRYYRPATIPIPIDIAGIAATRLDGLKTMNSTQTISVMDLPDNNSAYNIYSDRN